MLDELKKLNNEENYEVPVDFRKRVISELSSEKKKSKLSSYIISGLSVAAVVIVAVVVTGNSQDSTVWQNDKFVAQVNQDQENEETINDENTLLFSASMGLSKELRMDESNVGNDSIDKNAEAVQYAGSEDFKKQYSDEIVDMLKINGMSAELLEDDSVKVKAKKEDVEMVLYYFDGEIEITEQGEYCIIKEK